MPERLSRPVSASWLAFKANAARAFFQFAFFALQLVSALGHQFGQHAFARHQMAVPPAPQADQQAAANQYIQCDRRRATPPQRRDREGQVGDGRCGATVAIQHLDLQAEMPGGQGGWSMDRLSL